MTNRNFEQSITILKFYIIKTLTLFINCLDAIYYADDQKNFNL